MSGFWVDSFIDRCYLSLRASFIQDTTVLLKILLSHLQGKE
jgi:hypothetical protein